MASTSRFSALPQINIGRSRWNMNHDHPTTWQHGRIIPIDCVRVMPGDTLKLNLASLIRMSQPIVPIMDNIRCNVYAFFCPQRLVQEHTKEFFGENTTGAGPQLNNFYIPAVQFGMVQANVYGNNIPLIARPAVGSVSHYLHKPLVDGSEDLYDDPIMVSVLKERVYWRIYNEFFRPQQFVQPISLYTDDTAAIGIMSADTADYTQGDSSDRYIGFHTQCAITTKQFDYFTSGTLSPQYGPSVEIPLGDYAPLGVYGASDTSAILADKGLYTDDGWTKSTSTSNASVYFGFDNVLSNDKEKVLVNAAGTSALGYEVESHVDPKYKSSYNFATNLVANLSEATASSINTLRAAFATQRFLERNNYGTRYHEYIQVHFGVKPPLGLLQVPELIGEHHFNINIQQVLSTAGAAQDSSTKLGQPGANSVTGDKAMLFKKSFVEHGYVMILMTTTHDRHYTGGILRDDLKREMLEFYHPEFATLGDQATKRLEIQFRNNSNRDYNVNDTFGYQEHWAEYRYIPSQASGLLDPYAANALSMWTLTNTYSEDVALDEGFLLEDRNALAAALVTGQSGPDYIGDFYFNYDVVRPMPLYSIPGRIDHVGNW